MKTIIFKSEKKSKIYFVISEMDQGIYKKGELIQTIKTDNIDAAIENFQYKVRIEESPHENLKIPVYHLSIPFKLVPEKYEMALLAAGQGKVSLNYNCNEDDKCHEFTFISIFKIFVFALRYRDFQIHSNNGDPDGVLNSELKVKLIPTDLRIKEEAARVIDEHEVDWYNNPPEVFEAGAKWMRDLLK